MSWIAEYDTQGMEFPTCVHVTKTTGTMTHGATYVPIEEGKAVRAENAKLRELVRDMHKALFSLNLDHCQACPREDTCVFIHECAFERDMRELGVEVDDGAR